jgi:O-antigen ligase
MQKFIRRSYKINNEKILFFLWVGILFSINSLDVDLIKFYKLEFNLDLNYIYKFINSIRFILPFIIFIILFFYLFFLKKKIDLLVIFFIYIIWQILILFSLGIKENLLNNLQLTINSISVLILLCFANRYEHLDFEKKLLIFCLIFIGIISFYFLYNLIGEKNLYGLKYLYSTRTLDPGSPTFSQATPRVTGISRMFVIIFFLIFIITIKEYKIKKNYLILIPAIILNLIIYILQSRGSFLGVILIYILYLLFYEEKIQKKMKFLFLTFLTPIIIYESIYYFNHQKIALSDNEINYKSSVGRILPEYFSEGHKFTYYSSTSGRIKIWETSLKIIKEKKIFLGYGPQADRFLLSEHILSLRDKGETVSVYQKDDLLLIFDNNASNALIYSYLSGGVVGLLLILIIYYIIIKETYRIIIIKKNIFSDNIVITFSYITLFYLTIRTIFENGFSVFGIDFVFFILVYCIIYKNNKLIKNTN